MEWNLTIGGLGGFVPIDQDTPDAYNIRKHEYSELSIKRRKMPERNQTFQLERTFARIIKLFVGVVVGGLLGYGVYRFIGCSSGTCPITSNPWLSTIFGMTLGALLTRSV